MLLSALCSELSMYKLINSTSQSMRQPLLVHCPKEEAERLREAKWIAEDHTAGTQRQNLNPDFSDFNAQVLNFHQIPLANQYYG